MSYEGYDRVLCPNGHLDEFNCYAMDVEDWVCHCGQKAVWSQDIDQTNGFDERTVYPLELDKPAVTECCDKCGSVLKVVEKDRYKIPSEEQMKIFRDNLYGDEE